uniref:Uncharacterized protein n=1 Tax=Arundo donax TaxID=35708 RepID=A0A0A8ZBQ4_ARUDO
MRKPYPDKEDFDPTFLFLGCCSTGQLPAKDGRPTDA